MASKPWLNIKRKQWMMKYRPDPAGKWVRVVLCKHPLPFPPSKPPKKPPQEALDRAQEFAEIEYRAKHGLGAAPPRARGLAGYMTAYLEAFRATHDAGSTKQLERHIRHFGAFATARGIAAVQGVTKALCRDYLEARAREVSAGTLRTERGYLRPIWTRAVDDGLIPANPWAGVPIPGKVVTSKPTFWSGEQVTAIARACARPWQSDLVLVLANTGIRISAALAMRWAWIDWPKGSITVPREHSKSGKPYTVAMTRVARDVLQRRQGESKGDLVFPNPHRGGGVVPYDSARDAIDRAIRKAKVPHGTPHDLRHSYARALALSGMPLNVVQAQLGHAALAMTQKYVDVTDQEASRFVEDWGIGEETSGSSDTSA